uniref:Sushi domain-containing protein n=1 Tax=Gongylonema pulchrum TaxID=637853 RepID=A0A183DL63_9BILA
LRCAPNSDVFVGERCAAGEGAVSTIAVRSYTSGCWIERNNSDWCSAI